MQKNQSVWSRIKTYLIALALTLSLALIVGATRVDPPPLFPEIVMGQVDDDDALQLTEAELNAAESPGFFAIVEADGGGGDDDGDDDADFLDLFGGQ